MVNITLRISMVLLIFVTHTVVAGTGNNIYVDGKAKGNQSGNSWINAFTTITSAVNAANENDTLIIAEGVYKEGQELLIDKVLTLKGGYPAGGGIQDINNRPTVIDGNKSHRVIHATANLHLQGLIIRYGAGVTEGAGIYAAGTTLQLSDTKVMYSEAKTTLITFTDPNPGLGRSHAFGGGIFGGHVVLTNSIISGNKATNMAYQRHEVSGYSFSNSSGGGIYADTITMNNSIISGNSAVAISIKNHDSNGFLICEAYGGGVYANTVVANNSQINLNTANATPLILTAGAGSTARGAGLYASDLILTNSLVAHNTIHRDSRTYEWEQTKGAGFYTPNSATLQNSILWGNTINLSNGQIQPNENSGQQLISHHSLIKGQNPVGVGNVDNSSGIDHYFIDGNNGNFELKQGSALIDTGENAFLPNDSYDVDGDGDINEIAPWDKLGQPRIKNTLVDIGPYESDFSTKNYASAAQTYYFSQNSSATTQDGLSWGTAFSRLNDYFHIADKSNINQILLSQGHYKLTGHLNFEEPIEIKGGYHNEIGERGQAYSHIDAQFNGRAIQSNDSIYLEKLSISNGLHTQLNTLTGGGAAIFGGDITLKDTQVNYNTLLITDMVEGDDLIIGGAIRGNNLTLINSQIGNTVLDFFSNDKDRDIKGGGGVVLNLSDPHNSTIRLINSSVFNNSIICIVNNSRCAIDGGGLWAVGSVEIINSIIQNNAATLPASNYFYTYASAGGVFASNLTLINSLVFNNKLQSNQAIPWGAGLFATTIDSRNSIIWGNVRVLHNGQTLADEYLSQNITAHHSLIKDQYPTGNNNIDATLADFDPHFMDEPSGDLRLLAGSPMIDTGNLADLPDDLYDVDNDQDTSESHPLDSDRLNRLKGVEVDIGPYEFQHKYFIGGSVTGLISGNVLSLKNDLNQLTITSNGPFVFAVPLEVNDNYDVLISSPPMNPIQPCTITNGSGLIGYNNVSNIQVNCDSGTDLIYKNGFQNN